jgi:glyoxylase-like metal-dependent hydrolase (beta-lactamase superfamily II)
MLSITTLTVGPLATNCYLLAETESRVAGVIDPGGEAAQILAELAKQGRRLQHIWLTHAHFDHIGAVADLAEATGALLAVHAEEASLLRLGGGGREWGFRIRPCPEPQMWLAAGQKVVIGATELAVLWVPGHTPGHVAFYAAGQGAVFTGDTLFKESIGRTDLPGGDAATLQRSLREQLLPLPEETRVYPGHGPATTIGAEKRRNPFLSA